MFTRRAYDEPDDSISEFRPESYEPTGFALQTQLERLHNRPSLLRSLCNHFLLASSGKMKPLSLVDSGPETKPELSVSALRFSYFSDQPEILDLRELSVPRGQFISLLGASGSGKSTLLRLFAGLLLPSSGTITVRSRSVSKPSSGIGMVFQHANLIPWRTARQNVALPAELGPNARKVDNADIDRLFRLVGLDPGDTSKRPWQLSGGMQMRVSLARALVLQPAILLLDEPFSALDDLLRMQLEEDMRTIHRQQNLTTVLVTHNISQAVFMSDRVLVLGNKPTSLAADINIELPSDRTHEVRQRQQFHRLIDEVAEALRSTATATI